MSDRLSTYFNKTYWLTAILIFIFICLRAFFIPFSHDEAATFFFYVQPGDYLPYKAHVYTNNHILNSALANICYHLGGSHRFVLRIPNIISFVILCIGIYRHFAHLTNITSKILLAGIFFFTFNFLDFFELCRGYGISMGCLLLGTSFLADYFNGKRFKYILLFSIFLQLAVAANLILVVVACVILVYVLFFQLLNKNLFNLKNFLLQLSNLVIIGFWVKFSFFLKNNGSLDYGVGDNYWEVTFKTLMQLLFGSSALAIQIASIVLFVIIILITFRNLTQQPRSLHSLFKLNIFYPVVLCSLIIGFYLQKKLLDVNYPEDRTGLFFFVFFVLSLVFVLDNRWLLSLVTTTAVVCSLIVSFVTSVNLSHFSSPFYHTMPRSLYQQLEKQFNQDKKLFTVGGHRVRELNYAFLNYKGMLNPMDDSEEMQMNCDYYYAMNIEKAFYDPYYTEIGYDKTWERVLLKRKEKIEHDHFYSVKDFKISGSGEFYEIKRFTDSAFQTIDPVEVYAEINFKKVPKPFKAFFVLQVTNEKNEMVWYKRNVLNWLDNDLNEKTKHIKLTTGSLPSKATIVVYLWNIDKADIDINVKDLQLYRLRGKGVNVRVPAGYYTLIYNLTKKPLL